MEKTTAQSLENFKIEPFTLIHDIVVNWWVILLGALAAMMFSYVIVGVQYVPKYTTTAVFAVSDRNTSASYSILSSANETANNFQRIVESNAMQKILCEKLGTDEIDADIQATVAGETNLLNLTVTAASPQESFDVMEGILENYSDVSYYIIGDVVLNIIQNPSVPFFPSNPMSAMGTMKKAFAGGFVGMIVLFGVISLVRDTLKSEEDISRKLDARSLGAISYELKYKTLKELIHRKKKGLLITDPIAGFRFTEGYRKFSSRVEYQMEKKGWKILAVTSVSENEGKSTVAANLALSLAQKDNRVILVDGDLRRPSQFLIFGLDPKEENELGEYLKEEKEDPKLLMKTSIPKLYVAGGRNCYSTSTDILQNDTVSRFLDLYRGKADYIIIDTPPTAVLGDAELWGACADAVLFVERQNFIRAVDINTLMDKFREEGVQILGVVMNSVMTISSFVGAGAGRYGGYYGRYGKYADRHEGSEK